ncbi:MAG: HAD-IA family hydrolase [Deltaproteobacteria bacterium]|nr:HAD-IA family hydrolase [Deltaproteobacteria bacterium]
MAQINAVFFDAAGTLFETREPVGETYARIAREYGVDTTAEAVDAAFRRAFRAASPLAFGPDRKPEELRRLERTWWRDLVAQTFDGSGQFSNFDSYFNSLFEFFSDPAHWAADPEATPTLKALREQGLILGVISNFDYRLYRILEGLRLSPWLESITISSEAGYAKPSPQLFQAALERHRIGPARAIHVGDSEHLDIAGASAAGLAAVLINRGKDMSTTGGIKQISSLAEIIDLVRALDAG